MMEYTPQFSDEQIDAIISGTRTGDPRADELGADLSSLRRALTAAPSGRMQWTQLAAMREVAEGHGLTSRSRRRFAATIAAIAATLGSVGMMGGMATAGILPAPVQHTVEAVGDAIGVEVHAAHPGHGESDVHKTTPGQAGTTPGQSATTPGQAGTTPGQSATTPGQSATTPGQGTHDG